MVTFVVLGDVTMCKGKCSWNNLYICIRLEAFESPILNITRDVRSRFEPIQKDCLDLIFHHTIRWWRVFEVRKKEENIYFLNFTLACVIAFEPITTQRMQVVFWFFVDRLSKKSPRVDKTWNQKPISRFTNTRS